MPVKDAGCLIEPPVSVPIVAGVNLAASADDDPPDEPPGTKFSDLSKDSYIEFGVSQKLGLPLWLFEEKFLLFLNCHGTYYN